MNIDESIDQVAMNCFGFPVQFASAVEEVAGRLMKERAKKDWVIYKGNVEEAGKYPFGRAPVARPTHHCPYDEPLLDVMDGHMLVAEIREAFEAKYPEIYLPTNLSMALLRLQDQGRARRYLNHHRRAVWSRVVEYFPADGRPAQDDNGEGPWR